MKKNNANNHINPITFTSARTVVTADRYVPHALYVQNKAIVEQLGGEIITGVGEFRAKFAKVADAKAFVEQAVTHMSAKEYNAARKTEPKAPTSGKGASKRERMPMVEYVTLTDADGNAFQVPKSALTGVKGKGSKTHKPMSGRVGVESEQKVLLEARARKGKGDNKPTSSNTNAKAPTRKAKGNGFDFTTIKGADNKAKNKALHQALVKMGLKDSRTPEYMAVWNARPWAK